MIASGDRIKTMDIDTIYRLSRDRLITIGIRINTANSTYAIAKPRNLSIAGRIPFTLQSSANAKRSIATVSGTSETSTPALGNVNVKNSNK